MIGDPALLRTDVGPVIDEAALRHARGHATQIARRAPLASPARGCRPTPRDGHFFAPLACRSTRSSALEREVFGPILHVVRYRVARARSADRCDQRDGLRTHASASTAASTAPCARGRRACRAGNVYVNRNMIGAVVGDAAVRRLRPLGHRAQGRRPALPAPFRARAHADGQYLGRGRQRDTAGHGIAVGSERS